MIVWTAVLFWIREMFFTKTKVTTILMVLEAADNDIHEVRYILWDLCLGVVIWRSTVSFQLFWHLEGPSFCFNSFVWVCMGVWLCISIAMISLFLGLLQYPMEEHTESHGVDISEKPVLVWLFLPSDIYTLWHIEFIKRNADRNMVFLSTSL